MKPELSPADAAILEKARSEAFLYKDMMPQERERVESLLSRDCLRQSEFIYDYHHDGVPSQGQHESVALGVRITSTGEDCLDAYIREVEHDTLQKIKNAAKALWEIVKAIFLPLLMKTLGFVAVPLVLRLLHR